MFVADLEAYLWNHPAFLMVWAGLFTVKVVLLTVLLRLLRGQSL